ncbi:MAG: hypothetical protein ABWZ40_15050, partial [Caulobacterales bacterium]
GAKAVKILVDRTRTMMREIKKAANATGASIPEVAPFPQSRVSPVVGGTGKRKKGLARVDPAA